jgi:hypothetical protein
MVTDLCRCGAGHILIDVETSETDWDIKSGSSGRITCPSCAEKYALVHYGRGMALVLATDMAHRRALHERAAKLEKGFLSSPDTKAAIAALVEKAACLPTAAAKYRLMRELHLESSTQATFTKHIRGRHPGDWIPSYFSQSWSRSSATRGLINLSSLLRYLEIPPEAAEACIAECSSLGEQAQVPPEVLQSWGPINLFAAISEDGKKAAQARAALGGE